jgi:hypothetical protein
MAGFASTKYAFVLHFARYFAAFFKGNQVAQPIYLEQFAAAFFNRKRIKKVGYPSPPPVS